MSQCQIDPSVNNLSCALFISETGKHILTSCHLSKLMVHSLCQGCIYLAYSEPWLLMPWQHKGPRYHQPDYSPNSATHYSDVIMGAMVSQITSFMIKHLFRRRSKKHQSSVSLAFVQGIDQQPVNSLHKWPVTRRCFYLVTSSWYSSFNIRNIKFSTEALYYF